MIVGIIQRQQQLNRKTSHNGVWKPAFRKPGLEAAKSLSDKLKYKTYVSPVRTFMLEIIH